MRVKSILKYGFGFCLLALLLAMTDIRALTDMVRQMHSGHALLGLLCFILTSGLDMWRLWLASPAARHLCWPRFIRMHLESYIMAQLLPGHMGVDAYRVAIIGKNGDNYMEPAVILFGLRVLSMVIMAALTVGLIFLLPEWQSIYQPYLLAITQLPVWIWGVALAVSAMVLYAVTRLLHKLWKRMQHRFSALSHAYSTLSIRRTFFLISISGMMIVLRIATFIFTLYAFGIDMPLLLASSVALCATLSWLLPLSPAGIGVREGVTTGLLVWLGTAYTPALAVALLNRLYFVGFAVLGGLSFMLPQPASKPLS